MASFLGALTGAGESSATAGPAGPAGASQLEERLAGAYPNAGAVRVVIASNDHRHGEPADAWWQV